MTLCGCGDDGGGRACQTFMTMEMFPKEIHLAINTLPYARQSTWWWHDDQHALVRQSWWEMKHARVSCLACDADAILKSRLRLLRVSHINRRRANEHGRHVRGSTPLSARITYLSRRMLNLMLAH